MEMPRKPDETLCIQLGRVAQADRVRKLANEKKRLSFVMFVLAKSALPTRCVSYSRRSAAYSV